MPLPRSKLDHLDTAILQVKSLVPKTQEYLESHGDELISKYLIPEIKSIALGMNMPQGFVDGVGFIRIDRNTFQIVNRWGTKDKPLALWFNEGTKDHFIAPLGPWALHWKDKQGNDRYSKGHMVRGIRQTRAMERGIELGMSKLMSNITGEIKDSVGKKLGVY